MNLGDSPVSSHTDSLTQNGSENMTLGTFHIKKEDYDLSIRPFCMKLRSKFDSDDGCDKHPTASSRRSQAHGFGNRAGGVVD